MSPTQEKRQKLCEVSLPLIERKRKNINNTKVSFDENNNLYLTLPKFDYGKRIRDEINERLQKEAEKVVETSDEHIFETDQSEKKRRNFEKLIPEFYQYVNTKSEDIGEEMDDRGDSDSDVSSLDEAGIEAMNLRLKTKTNFKYKILPPIEIRGKSMDVNTLNVDTNIRGRSIKTNQEIQSLFQSSPILQNLRKMREKITIINKGDRIKKNNKVLGVDIFHYDKKKWQKMNLREVSIFV